MKPEIKQLWVSSLRSGEYKQGKYVLKVNDLFCCLGVLCDLHRKHSDNPKEWRKIIINEKESIHYNSSTTTLPKVVSDWAGLSSFNPIIKELGEIMTLAELNDSGKTFIEIADIIEKYL